MGRWRPPPPKSSPYITADGYATLQSELKGLWKKRTEVVNALSAAAAEGDRSENAEYIYRKKELAGIDRRVRYLQKRLPNLTVVEQTAQTDRIFFGAWVALEDADGRKAEYRIVGPDEANACADYLSMDAPLARALMKKTVDDEVTIRVEEEERHYLVVGIRYA